GGDELHLRPPAPDDDIKSQRQRHAAEITRPLWEDRGHGFRRSDQPPRRVEHHDALGQRAVLPGRGAVHVAAVLELARHSLQAAYGVVVNTRSCDQPAAPVHQWHDVGIRRAVCPRGCVQVRMGRHKGLPHVAAESASHRAGNRAAGATREARRVAKRLCELGVEETLTRVSPNSGGLDHEVYRGSRTARGPPNNPLDGVWRGDFDLNLKSGWISLYIDSKPAQQTTHAFVRHSLPSVHLIHQTENSRTLDNWSQGAAGRPDNYPVSGSKIPRAKPPALRVEPHPSQAAAMLPSRGIARSLPSAGARRLIQSRRPSPPSASSQRLRDGRQFGTSLRSAGGGLVASPPLRSRNLAAPIVLGGISSARAFSLWGYGKKTTAVPEPAAETSATAASEPVRPVDPTPENTIPAPPTEPAVPAAEVDLSSISDIINGKDILNMPEQLGYLHAIGLDYGWGPTSVMQWTLEHVHIWMGLGWGASIMATAFVLRAIMFYPQIRSLKFNAVMQNMRKDPRSQEAMKLVQQGFQERDMEMRQKGQYLNKMLREQYGASNWGIMWSLMQIPFTFGLFRIVSGMTNIPVPSLETAGFLWFTDLTATDPYFILPAVGTGLMIAALAINSKHTPESQKKMMKSMMYIFGSVGFIGTTFLSAAVNLMTVAVGASTLITAIVLNNAVVRRAVGLPPAPSP
ncbi:Mitochondrial inner membrane protein OXA1, partial [Tolypocladium capitatum]